MKNVCVLTACYNEIFWLKKQKKSWLFITKAIYVVEKVFLKSLSTSKANLKENVQNWKTHARANEKALSNEELLKLANQLEKWKKFG